MNKYIQSILLFGIVLALEAAPFLYKETYEIEDLKWGWIVGLPIILLIRNFYEEGKEKRNSLKKPPCIGKFRSIEKF